MVNPENKSFFYTGTYAPEAEKGIFLCSLDTETGEMAVVNGLPGIANPSYLTLNAAGDRLYAVSETGSGEIFAYSIDNETGELHLLDRMPTEGADPCYVSLTRDGQFAMVSNYSSGHINVFRIGETGGLAEMSSIVKHSGRSIRDDRQEGPHPHSIFQDPEGRFVLVCDLGLDEIVLYRLEDGKLVTHGEVKTTPGAGPRHFDFHPSGKWAYGINELDNTVTVFAYNGQAGELKVVQNVSTLPEDFTGESFCADIHISPCGRFLYGSNRGDDSIVLFHINESTGELTPVDWVSTGGEFPRNFAIISGYLIAANQNTGNMLSYKIDSDSGRLTPTGFALELPKPVCIQQWVKGE